MERMTTITDNKLFLQSDLPIFVNRVHETFDMITHHHDFIEISCVAEGIGTHYIHDQTLTVKQGDIFYIPLGIAHVFRPHSTRRDRQLVMYNCIINAPYFYDLLESIPDNHKISTFYKQQSWRKCADQYGVIMQIFQKLHYEYTSMKAYYESTLQALVTELMIQLFRFSQGSKEKEASIYISGLDAVLHAIQSRFTQPVRLHQMAAIMGVSERQFHRIFRQHTGMHLLEYIQNLRIQEACKLLRETDMKVYQIAEAVGYKDMGYFNQLFKLKTGGSPRQFRNASQTVSSLSR